MPRLSGESWFSFVNSRSASNTDIYESWPDTVLKGDMLLAMKFQASASVSPLYNGNNSSYLAGRAHKWECEQCEQSGAARVHRKC